MNRRIIDSKNREFDEKILIAIAEKYSLSDVFIKTAKRFLAENDRNLIVKSFKESAFMAVILIIPLWWAAYLVIPELFQSQSDALTKVLGYLLLISSSLFLGWNIFKARMPMVERGSFEEELQSAEKNLKPMIDKFLVNPSKLSENFSVDE